MARPERQQDADLPGRGIRARERRELAGGGQRGVQRGLGFRVASASGLDHGLQPIDGRRDTAPCSAPDPSPPRSRVTVIALVTEAKCGDRSSATSAPRVKFAATASRTRSSAAAVGSAASGSASVAWYGILAAPKEPRPRDRGTASGALNTTAVRSSGAAFPSRLSALSCRAMATSSSSRSRNVHHGSSVGRVGRRHDHRLDTCGAGDIRGAGLQPCVIAINLVEPGPPGVQALVKARTGAIASVATMSSAASPGILVNRSKSAAKRPWSSAIQSATVTIT